MEKQGLGDNKTVRWKELGSLNDSTKQNLSTTLDCLTTENKKPMVFNLCNVRSLLGRPRLQAN